MELGVFWPQQGVMRAQQLAAMARHEPLITLVGERTEEILIQQQISSVRPIFA